jgi:predicted dehydrogenase
MENTSELNRPKVALIGLGAVAEPHLIALESLDSIRVVGGVDPRAARRSEFFERFGLRGFESVADLLAQSKPDIACLLTPASTHRALTEQCAKAGVNVLCEKPMAVTVEDAVAMRDVCEQSKVSFFYGSSYRFLPAVRMAKSLIESGAIGEVRLVVEHLLTGEGAESYRPLSSSHYPVGGPGGGGYGLVDHGIHLLDVIPWMCGSPITSVLGRGDRTGAKSRPEFALIGMRNGADGIVLYDGSTRSLDLPWEGIFSEGRQWIDGRGWVGECGQWERGAGSIQVYGSEGALRIFHYANRLFINRSDKCEELSVGTGATPYHFGRQLEQFCDNLRRHEAPATPAVDGIRALRVLHAIYESELAGQWQIVEAEKSVNIGVEASVE